jgi:hypothetical protein
MSPLKMDEVECEEWAAGGGLLAVFEALVRFALWFLHALGFALVFALVTFTFSVEPLEDTVPSAMGVLLALTLPLVEAEMVEVGTVEGAALDETAPSVEAEMVEEAALDEPTPSVEAGTEDAGAVDAGTVEAGTVEEAALDEPTGQARSKRGSSRSIPTMPKEGLGAGEALLSRRIYHQTL